MFNTTGEMESHFLLLLLLLNFQTNFTEKINFVSLVHSVLASVEQWLAESDMW